MSVPLDTRLHRVADALRERITPMLDDSFARETARLGGLLLTLTAEALDDAAALRVDENAGMRALFGEASAVVADSDLAAKLSDAAQTRDPSLKLSQLDSENDRLRVLLVALHAQLEGQEDAAARTLDQRIWAMLRDFEMRRGP